MYDNSILQIFSKFLNLEKIFLCKIEHLVCRSMCYENFENLWIKKFEKGFSVEKIHARDDYFPLKIFEFLVKN